MHFMKYRNPSEFSQFSSFLIHSFVKTDMVQIEEILYSDVTAPRCLKSTANRLFV